MEGRPYYRLMADVVLQLDFCSVRSRGLCWEGVKKKSKDDHNHMIDGRTVAAILTF